MLFVNGFSSRRGADGNFEFFVTVEQDGHPFELALPIEAVMHYRVFVAFIAQKTGQVYWLGLCEHKNNESADSAWRAEISHAVTRQAKQEADAAKDTQKPGLN